MGPVSVSALPGVYPILVYNGDKVSVKKVNLKWKGTAGSVYVCWGLKAGTGDFNNGGNLVNGHYATSVISLPAASDFVSISKVVDIALTIDAPTGRIYDVYVWLSYDGSANESQMVDREPLLPGLPAGKVLDTDTDIIKVIALEARAKDLEVLYSKV